MVKKRQGSLRMKRILCFILIFLSFSAFTKNILIVGDSHMANPLGQYLLNHFASLNHNVAIFGHASSAPIDWLGEQEVKHKGGVYHAAYYNKKYYKNPKPTHWKEYIGVLKFNKLLNNMLYHPEWVQDKPIKPDVVIVELGANDAKAIADINGNKKQPYSDRFDAAFKMSSKIVERGAKCIWILPPNGVAKPKKNQEILYEMLQKAISKNCFIYTGSKKFVAEKNTLLGCDGYHFNCNKKEKMKAFEWSLEIKKFFQEKI